VPFRPDLYRILVESVEAFAIFVLDLDGRVRSWNPGAERIFGYLPDEIVGEDGRVIFTEEDRAAGVPEWEIAEAIRAGSAPDNRWHLRKDGERIWVSGVARALRAEGGNVIAVAKVLQDVSLHKGEGTRYAESERERLLASMTEGLIVARADGTVVEVNPAAAALHGFGSAAEMLYHIDEHAALFEVSDPETGACVPVEDWAISRALRGERFVDYRLRARRKDGGAGGVWSYSGTPVFGPQGPLSRAFVTVRDVTAEAEATRALRELNAELEARVATRTEEVRRLAEELVLTEERERQRVAEVLHDHVQQLLVAAQMRVHALSGKGGEAVDREASVIAETLAEAVEATRTLVAELIPLHLEGEGDEGAFRWLSDYARRAYGLRVEVAVAPAPALPPAHRVLLLQIARELLFNVVKHAGTDRARLSLRKEGGGWTMRVEDEGAGCDPTRGVGVGLTGVRERAERFGGWVEVGGHPGAGTSVAVWLPAL